MLVCFTGSFVMSKRLEHGEGCICDEIRAVFKHGWLRQHEEESHEPKEAFIDTLVAVVTNQRHDCLR